ncbi:MAG: nucleotide exchange factor GrpE [Elusimicrobiota bacterium]
MSENKNTEDIYREAKIAELEILKQSVDEQKKKAESYYEQLLRLKADFENYRKRVEKEKKIFFENGKNSTLLELIDVFETVKLAKSMIEKSNNHESVQEGLHHIEKKLEDILKQHNVTQIKTIGEKFNPLFHEVVGVIEKVADGNECAEDSKDGIILEELKSGYKIGENVLKPAMVKISKQTNDHELTTK